VTALACPIRARWRSGCVNHRVESCADRSPHGLLVPAQRPAVQRRAVEIGMTVSTKSRSKIALISGRGARPLQRLVRPQPMLVSVRGCKNGSGMRLHIAELRLS
jgi:hypothetical protein